MLTQRILSLCLLSLLCFLTTSSEAKKHKKTHPTLYLIRHGEKPSDGGDGLTTKGKKRAECLSKFFGPNSDFNIGYIMAQEPHDDGHRQRPYDTVKPLAQELGLKVDTSCDRDDMKCVKKIVKNYRGEGNILLCWEHGTLHDIVETLGIKKHAPYYPDRYDIIWHDPYPYDKITDVTKEQCPKIDSYSIRTELKRRENPILPT